ncbi:hypothetical protein ILUMI_10202 [Ignelater luminosus]|uniref:THAP-type domain-containing protein n=1 Tax=Ignelater luminosus TaxID=2038154 RepID=A0A8K0D2Q2_IGNLU|nr:hypothetical protein ILUMI_10202 [Ignelater luminosus]
MTPPRPRVSKTAWLHAIDLLDAMKENKTKQKRAHSKYCAVPECTNTSLKTPNKIFISIPKDNKKRISWQRAMRRAQFLSPKSHKYCCEDHFNLKEDVENYRYFTMMKDVPVRLKPGVVPHIFDCQKEGTTVRTAPSRAASLKKRLQSISTEDDFTIQKTHYLEDDKLDTTEDCDDITIKEEPLEIKTCVEVINYKGDKAEDDIKRDM